MSPSGPRKLFKGVTTAMSVVIDRFPLLLPVRNPAVGYGASAVTRTPDRGHVAEVKNQCHRGGGVLGICNYVELIDPTFRGAGGVD